MLDPVVRRWIAPALDRIAARAVALGLSADTVTVSALGVGLAAVPVLATQHYHAALALILANRLLDGLDGAVARRTRPTDRGAYLDIVGDFIFYSAVVFGFALARAENALAGAFLIFSFVGTGSSFLAFAVFAAKRGLATEASGPKSIYYLGGLTEGTETIIAFVAFCLFPLRFALLATVFAALCWVTTTSRVAYAVRTLGSVGEREGF